jgi:hypothetical protein
VLLLGGGLTLLLFAMRLVAAAFGCAFTPFAYLVLPDDHGWQALLFAGLAAACVVLLALVLDDARDELWLAREDGGVLVPADVVELLLRDAALAHAEVVRADVEVRLRRGRVAAKLDVALRPLVDGVAIADDLSAGARDLLARVIGAADVTVRVRPRVLKVGQLTRHLP